MTSGRTGSVSDGRGYGLPPDPRSRGTAAGTPEYRHADAAAPVADLPAATYAAQAGASTHAGQEIRR